MSAHEMKPAYRYVAVVTAAGLTLFGLILRSSDMQTVLGRPFEFALFTALVIAGELVAIRIPRRAHNDEITTSTTFTFALLLLMGTGAAVLAQGLASLVADLRLRKEPWKAAFNVAQYTVAISAAGAVLRLGGQGPGIQMHTSVLPTIMLSGLAFFVVNSALTGTALALAQRLSPFGYVARDTFFQFIPGSVLLALSPIVVVAADQSLLLLPLMALPMAVAYRSTVVSLANERNTNRFRSMVQNAADIISIIDADGTVVYCSPSTETILGYPAHQFVGKHIAALAHPDDAARVGFVLNDVLRNPGKNLYAEYRRRNSRGDWLHFEAIWNNLLEDPSVQGIVVNARDITRRKTLEEQLSHQAFHDRLTRLANRGLFEDRVGQAIARSGRTKHPVGVLFVDLDDFKTVNDSLGHVAGDELLIGVAHRLSSSVRPEDTIARLGGDEFAVLLENASKEEARGVADRIFQSLRLPFSVRGREIFVGASIGIALSSGSETADDLLRNADVAMYSAKSDGKGRGKSFEPSMHQSVIDRLEIGADLQRAMERSEFTLEFQPIVALNSGMMTGVEALVRWKHPDRGLVPPGDFIPIAEETGLIREIGRLVLLQSCRAVQAWGTRLAGAERLAVSVNLSPRQLQDPEIVETVREVLAQTSLEPSRLTLEITEGAMMGDVEAAIGRLHELKGLGVALAIDDFGTGYSSFSYLRRLPIDVLKIDKAFVDGLGQGPEESALARAIIQLAKVLNLRTVAEGIESPEQLEELRRLGCQSGQGFLLGRPRRAEEVGALLGEPDGDLNRPVSVRPLRLAEPQPLPLETLEALG